MRPRLLLAAWLALPPGAAAAAEPAPCSGDRAAAVEEMRRQGIERVERASQVVGNRARPSLPLANGTPMTSGPLYTLVHAAMIFGDCPHDPDNLQATADCAAEKPEEWMERTMSTVVPVLTNIRNRLSSAPIFCSPDGDPFCGLNLGRGAYSRASGNAEHPRSPDTIYLCRPFFRNRDLGSVSLPAREGGIRTLIHESAHLAGITRGAGGGESYCPAFDCNSSCAPPNNADAWSHLVHCLSGSARDSDAGFNVTASPRR